MSKFIASPPGFVWTGSLTGRGALPAGADARRLLELLEVLSDRSGVRVVRRDLEDALVRSDRGLRVSGLLGGLGERKLDAGIRRRDLGELLVAGDRLAE